MNSAPDRGCLGRYDGRVLQRGNSSASVEHIEIPASDAIAASSGVKHIPGDRVHSVRERCGIDVEKSNGRTAICIAWEQARDVLTKLSVSRTSDHLSVNHYCNSRAIVGDHERLLGQRPCEVHIIGTRDSFTLVGRIDGPKRL